MQLPPLRFGLNCPPSVPDVGNVTLPGVNTEGNDQPRFVVARRLPMVTRYSIDRGACQLARDTGVTGTSPIVSMIGSHDYD